MNFGQALVLALVPTIGVMLTVFVSTRDLALRRKLEGTDKFFEIVMVAHARARDRDAVGTAEQIAAIHLLADFGRGERHLKNAAKAALDEIAAFTSDSSAPHFQRVHAAVVNARARVR